MILLIAVKHLGEEATVLFVLFLFNVEPRLSLTSNMRNCPGGSDIQQICKEEVILKKRIIAFDVVKKKCRTIKGGTNEYMKEEENHMMYPKRIK